MTRLLTAGRSRVAPERVAEYIATVATLSARLAARGQRLWLFRRRDGVDEFLEFSEGKDDRTHRRSGPGDAAEAELEARLAGLATYDGTQLDSWEEVPLHTS